MCRIYSILIHSLMATTVFFCSSVYSAEATADMVKKVGLLSPEQIEGILDNLNSVEPSAILGFLVVAAAKENKNPNVIRVLAKHGADIKFVDPSFGWTLLHVSSQGNPNPEVSSVIIELGVNVNAKDSIRQTALHLAVDQNNLGLVRLLIKSGANVNVVSAEGRTPLSIAKAANNKEIVNVLIAAGAKEAPAAGEATRQAPGSADRSAPTPSPSGKSDAIFELVRTGTLAQIQAAISTGLDVNAIDLKGGTLLHAAASKNPDPAVVTALIAAGVDVNGKGTSTSCTPLYSAVLGDNSPSVIRALISGGAKIDAGNDSGCTPLFAAVFFAVNNDAGTFKNAREIALLLIKAGADVNIGGANGSTPLSCANNNDNQEFVTILLAAGAKDGEQKTGSRTAEPTKEKLGTQSKGIDPNVRANIKARKPSDEPSRTASKKGFKVVLNTGEEIIVKYYTKQEYIITLYKENGEKVEEGLDNIKSITKIKE